MNDFGLSSLLSALVILGLIIAVIIWRRGKFLGWEKFFGKGVIVDGHIQAHRCQPDDAEERRRIGWLILEHEGFEIAQFFLLYTYDYNGTNYLHEEQVNEDLYKRMKDGDSVKVRCLPKDPMIAQLEQQLLSRR